MTRSKWEELLASTAGPNPSRADMIQQLTRIAGPASSGMSSGAGSAGAFSGALEDSTRDVAQQISSLATQMTNFASVQQIQVGAVQDNTQALAQNTASKPSAGAGGTAGSIASSVLGGGSVLSPIVGGLMDLFGVGDSTQPAATVAPFLLPAPVQYEGGIAGTSPGAVTPISYGEAGQPRAQKAASAPQINIQVNAMDSQSFLDHSDEIANAVKEALLNSHSLGDVISGV